MGRARDHHDPNHPVAGKLRAGDEPRRAALFRQSISVRERDDHDVASTVSSVRGRHKRRHPPTSPTPRRRRRDLPGAQADLLQNHDVVLDPELDGIPWLETKLLADVTRKDSLAFDRKFGKGELRHVANSGKTPYSLTPFRADRLLRHPCLQQLSRQGSGPRERLRTVHARRALPRGSRLPARRRPTSGRRLRWRSAGRCR